MDFAFAQGTTKYDRMTFTIHSYGRPASFVNPFTTNSIKYFFFLLQLCGVTARGYLLVAKKPIFKKIE